MLSRSTLKLWRSGKFILYIIWIIYLLLLLYLYTFMSQWTNKKLFTFIVTDEYSNILQCLYFQIKYLTLNFKYILHVKRTTAININTPILVPQTAVWIVSASSYHPMMASWHSDRASPMSAWPHDMIWVLHCSRPVPGLCVLAWSALVTQPWLAGASRGKWPWAPLVACDMCPASGGGSAQFPGAGHQGDMSHVTRQCHQHPMSTWDIMGAARMRTHSPADQIDNTSVHRVWVWCMLFCSWHPFHNPHHPSQCPYCEQHM